MSLNLIEKFLKWSAGKENSKGELLLASFEIINWLNEIGCVLTFKKFNGLLGAAYLGRSTGNRYRYSLDILKKMVETQDVLGKIDLISKKKFSSRTGMLLPNYYGNKHYFVGEYKTIFELLSKDCHTVCDAFCGSGVLSLLATDYFDKVCMNDRNSHLINFHRCMAGKDSVYKKMVSKIVTSPYITKEQFKELERQYTEQKYYRTVDEKSAGEFFLYQEFSWNGTGGYKESVRELKKITPYLNYTRPYYLRLAGIYNYSFKKFLTPYINDPQAVVLCDPPYELSLRYGGREQYIHEFSEENHRQLLRLVRNAKAKIILCCYVDTEKLETDLYYRHLLQNKYTKQKWHLLEIIRKSKHGKTEFLFANFDVEELIKTAYFREIAEP